MLAYELLWGGLVERPFYILRDDWLKLRDKFKRASTVPYRRNDFLEYFRGCVEAKKLFYDYRMGTANFWPNVLFKRRWWYW
jgi:hypothetical protein